MRIVYPVKLLEHGMVAEYPSLFVPGTFTPWAKNLIIKQHSLHKRPGYQLDRSLTDPVYGIALFQTSYGSRYTLYLTDKNLCKREGTSGKTFSYLTDTYTTGTVTGVSTTTITGSGTDWSTSGIELGDKFIMDSDHTSDTEIDSDWATVQSVDSDTQITLTADYVGAGTSGTYKIRKLYSVPVDERWSWAVVNDKFCFSNGNIDVQYWNGTSNFATVLDSTYAKQARYCIEYANRLFIADIYNVDTTRRDPYLIRWSKENDPTNWTDSTAGTSSLQDTEDYIMGLGKVGPNMIVYKKESFSLWQRTGDAVSPIERTDTVQGVGCIAPYSIVDVLGTNAWIGRDDFYTLDGSVAVSLSGERMRYKFFDIVSQEEAAKAWGFNDTLRHTVRWFATSVEGLYEFAWDYRVNEWTINSYAHPITSAGKGAV